MRFGLRIKKTVGGYMKIKLKIKMKIKKPQV